VLWNRLVHVQAEASGGRVNSVHWVCLLSAYELHSVCVFACEGPEVHSTHRVVYIPFHQAGNMGEPTVSRAFQLCHLELTAAIDCGIWDQSYLKHITLVKI